MAGKRWRLYYNTGSHESPVWAAVNRAVDIKLINTRDVVDASRRESEFGLEEGALKNTGIEFGYRYKTGTDTVRDALEDSYDDETKVQFAVADGDISVDGTKYTKLWGQVVVWDTDAQLKGEDLIPVKIAHVGEDDDGDFHEPEKVTVGAGT